MSDIEITLERAKELVELILASAWKGRPDRQKILDRTGKLNFCCPYCGDSKDTHKKRGNFYLKTLTYKCYNAGCIYSQHKKFRDLWGMLKDFGLGDEVNPNEKISIQKAVQERRKSPQIVYASNEDLITEDLKKKLILRSLLMEKLQLEEVIGTPMANYLRKRQQVPDKKFAADPKGNRLFIFNMDPKGEYVFGLQIRNFKYSRGSKYLTYRLSKIWTAFMGIEDEEFLKSLEKIDPVSTLFGIFTSNLTRTFTIFEGPLDSFLFPNSLALCSINNPFPFDLENKRWFLDADIAGKTKSIELIKEGNSVFLWDKFKKENQIPEKIKDLNSLIIHLRINDQKIYPLENYFSKDKWDLLNI